MTALFCVICALVGLCLGGVLYRLAYAFPRASYGEVLRPTCHACGAALPFAYRIPVLGVFLSQGRCPVCGEKRGVGALFAEVVFAVALVLLYVVYRATPLFFIYTFVSAVLLVLSIVDLDIKEVSHLLLLLIIAPAIALFVFSFFPDWALDPAEWWEHLIGAYAVSVPLFIVMMVTRGGVGGGDIKLMFCLGFLIGYKLVLFAFLVGIVIAAVVAVTMMCLFGKNGKYELPLVPFLSLGFLVSVLVGGEVIAALF